MTQFHIGSQQAGNITNVGGDATITSQHGTFRAGDARVLIGEVRGALRAAALDADVRASAERDLDGVEQAVEAGDEATAGSRLERLVTVLQRGGALAAAGAALVEPLSRLAQTLGPVGARVLALLPG